MVDMVCMDMYDFNLWYSVCYGHGFNQKQVFYGLSKSRMEVDILGISSLPNESHADLMASPTVKMPKFPTKQVVLGRELQHRSRARLPRARGGCRGAAGGRRRRRRLAGGREE